MKAANLIHKIMLSLISIYPLELRCFNKKQYETEKYAVFYYKELGIFDKSNFEIEFHEPD